jgi:hypothetical protein
MRCLLLAALLPACSLYFPQDSPSSPPPDAGSGQMSGTSATGTFELDVTRTMAGEHTVAGVDSDGSGGIWIAYCDDADYYTLKDVWVTHLDATGTKLSEWMLKDHYEPIHGIAFTGDRVWLNYSASGTGNRFLRALDATTGATLGTFAMEDGIADISYDADKDQLLLSNLWNSVIAIDPTTGGDVWRTTVSATGYSTQRGIAFDHGAIWLDEAFDNKFFAVSADGTVLATATAPAFVTSTSTTDQLQLAFDGSQLIAVFNNQIFWLAKRKL